MVGPVSQGTDFSELCFCFVFLSSGDEFTKPLCTFFFSPIVKTSSIVGYLSDLKLVSLSHCGGMGPSSPILMKKNLVITIKRKEKK